MKRPRITGHQLCMLIGMDNFAKGENKPNRWYANPKSWVNKLNHRVWNFSTTKGGRDKISGDTWDARTGASLLKKGLIEPAFTMKHDGSYTSWPDAEVTFYRLTELGRSYLS